MILLSRRSRFLTFAFALAQLALPGAFGVIDAMGAADARGQVSHIEETSRPGCRAPHTDDCIICRHLSTSATKGDAAASPIPATASFKPVASTETGPRSVSHLGLHSRAPPASLI